MLVLLNFLNRFQITSGEKGATTLSLFFSTMGGALFLFTFYNLSEYTAARSGAEQAARRAARCLSPSDPLCKLTVADGVTGNPLANWFGYQPSSGPTSVSVNTFKYSGEVTEEVYSAEYNSYQVHTAQNQIVWNEEEVKPQRFVGLLNSFANLKADITVYVKPILGGAEKACRLNNVVNLPAGIAFNEATYFDTRWCNTFVQGNALVPSSPVSSASNCGDVTADTWAPSPGADRSNSYCALTIPSPRSSGDLPWLLLGGEPVCDNSLSSPSQNIAQSIPELNQQFRDKGFKDAEPGDANIRPFPVTPSRQFLVVETFSCNPKEFLGKLETEVKSNSSLKSFFKNSDNISLPRFDTLPPYLKQDFVTNPADSSDQNSFIYQGLSGVSFIGEEDWTYLEWSRQADGLRHLGREVCQWLPWDEAVKKWPELGSQYDKEAGLRFRETPSGKKYYQSGNAYGPEIPSKKFTKAPSCLNPIASTNTPYTCANREVVGQPGTFNECGGWNKKKEALEVEYNTNVTFALELNEGAKSKNLQDLPTDFLSEVVPRYGSGIINPNWEFSWSGTKFNGKQIISPSSVRSNAGQNPKVLPSNLHASQLKLKNGDLGIGLKEKLLTNVSVNESGATSAGWEEALSSVNFVKVLENPLSLTGAWPFVHDGQNNPIPQVRPHIPGLGGNSSYDYNLDCVPERECQGAPIFNSIEEALRFYGNNDPIVKGKGDLNHPDVEVVFSEEPAGSVTMAIDQAKALPQCTAFTTTCGIGAIGSPIALGPSDGPPLACSNGTFVNCYAQYGPGDVGQQSYKVETDFAMARQIALNEIRTMLPQAVECPHADSPNCVAIDIEELNGEVRVNVDFLAPLTYPFNSMLGADTLLVKGSTKELLETERLK